MRAFQFIGLFLIALASTPARAEFTAEDMRAALQMRDFAVLEQGFDTAFKAARDRKDFFALRQMYTALFVTAHKERRGQVEAWLAEHPQSPYAATALAWSHVHVAFQYRGSNLARDTSADAFAAYHREMAIASRMTELALDQAPDFAPALDAAIVMRQTGIDRTPVAPLVDHALRAAPDRHTLRLGLNAVSPQWGGGVAQTVSMCGRMADRVPDYDAELCLIEAVFNSNQQGGFRDMALQALDGRDEPFLDYARLDAYLNEWRGHPDAPAEAMRIHRASLGPTVSVRTYQYQLERIATQFNRPLYKIEAQDALMAHMRARLKDDPQNVDIHAFFINAILDKTLAGGAEGRYAAARDHWQQMLVHGAYRARTWRLGAMVDALEHGWMNVARQRRFHENQVYYANHSASALRAYMNSLFMQYLIATGEEPAPVGAEVDPEARLAAVTCPMFRAYRLYAAACEADPRDPGCNIGGWQSDYPDRLRRVMRGSETCDYERTADLAALLYTPIPVEDFSEPVN